MHLKQPANLQWLWSFTKNKERIEKFMKTGNTYFIYKNELDGLWQIKRFSKKNTIR